MYLEDEARLRGIRTLTLGVDNWNSRAILFYKGLGYLDFKQEPSRTDNEFVIFMKKKIRTDPLPNQSTSAHQSSDLLNL